MAQYRKKPVIIEAFQWMKDEVPNWWTEASGKFNININSGVVFIPTKNGTFSCQPSDIIIKDDNGEIYSMKSDAFEKYYEAV
jgi:hypothetical protein